MGYVIEFEMETSPFCWERRRKVFSYKEDAERFYDYINYTCGYKNIRKFY